MKRQVLVTLAALSGLIPLTLGAAPARAQSEIDPDHFESPNVEPFDKLITDTASHQGTIRYNGNGKSMGPGKYSVSLRSDGKAAWATLNQDVRGIGFAGVVRNQARGYGNDALIVELKGTTRRLSAIEVASLDFVLDPDPQVKNSTYDDPVWLERLPLTETVRKGYSVS